MDRAQGGLGLSTAGRGAHVSCDGLRSIDATLIHLSSEYVFDGKDAPYAEDAPTAPLSLFGHYCREGEVERPID